MAVARSDDGPGNLTRRRLPRKVPDVGVPGSVPTSAPPTGPRSPSGLRLDDLYRLPMPKLFTLAEREGVAEHTGMNRAQLIVSVVRQQVVRGEVVRGAGTLEVLPDGYGFLRMPPTTISPRRKTSTSRRARFAGWACAPAWWSKGRSACRSKGRKTSP